MITQMPERLRLALGNDVSRDLEGWLEGLLVADYVQHTEWAETRDGLGRVEAGLDDVVRHLAASDMRQSAFEREMAEFKAEFREFRREVTERLDRQAAEMLAFSNAVNARLDRQYEQVLVQTRWNIGLIGLFGTIFAILYGIGQLKP